MPGEMLSEITEEVSYNVTPKSMSMNSIFDETPTISQRRFLKHTFTTTKPIRTPRKLQSLDSERNKLHQTGLLLWPSVSQDISSLNLEALAGGVRVAQKHKDIEYKARVLHAKERKVFGGYFA